MKQPLDSWKADGFTHGVLVRQFWTMDSVTDFLYEKCLFYEELLTDD